MVLNEFHPSKHLKEFIRVYRVVECKFDNNVDIPFKPYPPKPEQCLSFYPRDVETVEYAKSGVKVSNLHAVLFGQQNELTNRFIGKDFLVFQIVFNPGSLFRLTGIPSHQLTNCYLDAGLIFPNSSINEVNERLAESTNHQEMVHIVELFISTLVKKVKKEIHQLDNIGSLMLQSNEAKSIDWLAKNAYLSNRQFERKFLERMGVSPKYFNKVVRFENAFRMKNKFPHLDWLTISIHCGFYDYQHMAKDYKDLTQQTPTDFHILDLSAPERKFGEADTY
jgi:AraC-like DNA-binding protein